MRLSGMAPQFTVTKGFFHRTPSSWSWRAIRPLPTPDSTVINTVVFTEASFFVRAITLCMASLSETIKLLPTSSGTSRFPALSRALPGVSGCSCTVEIWVISLDVVSTKAMVLEYLPSPAATHSPLVMGTKTGEPVVRSRRPKRFSWIIVISRFSSRTLLVTEGVNIPDFSRSSTCLPTISSYSILYISSQASLHH